MRLKAYRSKDGANLLVWCVHCNAWHAHGAVGPTFGQGDGHRAAHCTKPGGPDGYCLVEVAEPKPTRKPGDWELADGPPQYAEAVIRAGMEANLKPGEVRHVAVMHDDWCALLKGEGACDCNPEVRMMDA